MKKRSRHHSSTGETHSSHVIQTSIRSWHALSSSSEKNKSLDRRKNLNTYSTNLSPRYHRNDLQERFKISNPVKPTDSLASPNENKYQRNRWNKISPEPNESSTETIHHKLYQKTRSNPHKVNTQTSNTSLDRIGTVDDHHRNRKKKIKCSPVCQITAVLIGIALALAAATIIAILVIKSKTIAKNRPTGTNYTLRWNRTGETVAGIVGQNGTAANQLSNPFGLAVDFSNTLYIADISNNRIQRWLRAASTGTTIAGQANGTWGKTATDFRSPAGILVDSNSNIYVADGGNSRIQLWSAGASSGVTIAGNGSIGNSSGQLANAYDMDLDSNSGTLYIADYSNHRIMSYASGASLGALVAGTGMSGMSTTQLSFPTSVSIDLLSNSLIIVNLGAHNIVRWALGASNWTLVGGSASGTLGNTSTLLNRPIGMIMDSMGNVYVADMSNHRIQLFLVDQSDGITITGVTGISDANSTLLYRPYSLALDNQLNLYISDTSNHRIQRFSRY